MKNLLFILLLGLGFSQTDIVTKKYTIDAQDQGTYTLNDLVPDYNLDWAIFNIVGTSTGECYVQQYSNVENHSTHILRANNYEPDGLFYYPNGASSSFYVESGTEFKIGFGLVGNHSCTILVTAEFPQEDTGYIEEGFEFCVHPGANLVSYPCDNPVSIEDALSDGVENYITAIIGEGIAAMYLPTGDWVGGLVDLQPGSGYWFKSNSNLCFEYDCVAD